MGAHLARLAFGYMPDDLSDRARLVLVFMCLQALDSDRGKKRGGLYFGGWESCATMLGYAAYDSAAKSATARAVRDLTSAKMIERWDVSTGHRVAYRLLPYVPGRHHPGGLDHRDPWQ